MGRLEGLAKILTDRKNLKYASADVGGFVCGLAAATAATIGLKEAGGGDGWNVLLTLGAKTAGFTAGNMATYLAVHFSDYRKGREELEERFEIFGRV